MPGRDITRITMQQLEAELSKPLDGLRVMICHTDFRDDSKDICVEAFKTAKLHSSKLRNCFFWHGCVPGEVLMVALSAHHAAAHSGDFLLGWRGPPRAPPAPPSSRGGAALKVAPWLGSVAAVHWGDHFNVGIEEEGL